MTSRKQRRHGYRAQVPQQSVQLEVMQEKQNPAYAGIMDFGGAPQPRQMSKNYKAYASEGYRSESTLYKVINYIMTNGAAIPPKLYTDSTMKTEIEKHPLLDKLARPNIEQSGVAYRKAVLGYFLVAGNSYQYAIRKEVVGPPDELWTLEPNKVEINAAKTRGVDSYNYTEFEGDAMHPVPGQNPIPAANIAHLKTWAPDDPLFGVSPIEVGALMVDMQTASKKWNLALLQNGGKMSGAFTTPMVLSPNDRKKLEEKLNEKVSGPRNAGKFAVLDAGLTWNQMGMPPAQMDWLPGMQYNQIGLADLYNIPPELTGDTSSSTYNNVQEAKAASYTEEIFPVLDDLYALWNMWLVPMYPDLRAAKGNAKAYLYYDKESVEVVQAVIQQQKTAKGERANAAWLAGDIMLDEARELQGLPPLPKKAGQVFRIGTILVRAEDMVEYAEQSLKTPVAAPMLVPENQLNVPPGGDPNVQPPDPTNPSNLPPPNKPKVPAKPGAKPVPPVAPGKKPAPKKSLDANGVYQPDDLQERLAKYYADGVTHVRWIADKAACDICQTNANVMVELGDPFPSGHILPPAHPHCPCEVTTFSVAERGKAIDLDERRRKVQARREYQEFMEEVL